MTVRDWGPDSPARFRAFYDWPAPVEFEAVLPDDVDGPADERQFLLDAAPFAKLAAVRVEPVVPASTVTQGATNAAPRHSETIPSGNDGSGDLRVEALKLARLLDPVAFDDHAVPKNVGQSFDRYSRQQTAMDHATIALIRGYRLVSDDEATVDRVAETLWREFWREVPGYGITKEFWRGPARAAVRALREAGQ
ncbi:MAG: hypothetical protein WBA97_34425 [Actinophytocola sp.]|uniref:hypothetical protein n=1 Tax=Actinophytocola sp. TaxID=1872138 RepID=UPI003C726D81